MLVTKGPTLHQALIKGKIKSVSLEDYKNG